MILVRKDGLMMFTVTGSLIRRLGCMVVGCVVVGKIGGHRIQVTACPGRGRSRDDNVRSGVGSRGIWRWNKKKCK